MTILRRIVPMLAVASLTALSSAAAHPVLPASTSATSASAARQDLSELFAPPTQAEIDAVRADWAQRVPTVEGYRLEATHVDMDGIEYHVVSHVVDGQRHYGAVRFPRNYVAGQPYATLVVCHGGLIGVSVEQSDNFLFALPGQCVDDEYFLVIPSFRGEPLETDFAGTFQSGGAPSFADRDVDDTRALLSAVLMNFPDMDHARVGAWGISRGGAVALLLTIRDERIRRVVDIFGFTDFTLPSVRDKVDQIINQGVMPSGIGRVAYESFVQPWLAGAITLAEARQGWLRRSACYFAEDLPAVQAHHGLADFQVDASHTQVLLGALAAAGYGPPDYQGYFYPNGMHGLNSLPGHGLEVEPFLCELQNGPRSFCGPMTPNGSGLYASADYRGSCSVAQNSLEFRANNCPPNSVGLVFLSANTDYRPSGAGFICLGSGLRRLGAAAIDSGGMFRLPVELANPDPQFAALLGIGSTAYLQVVFRDNGNPNGAFNWSNGLEITIEP